jgi:hypothetical protein
MTLIFKVIHTKNVNPVVTVMLQTQQHVARGSARRWQSQSHNRHLLHVNTGQVSKIMIVVGVGIFQNLTCKWRAPKQMMYVFNNPRDGDGNLQTLVPRYF